MSEVYKKAERVAALCAAVLRSLDEGDTKLRELYGADATGLEFAREARDVAEALMVTRKVQADDVNAESPSESVEIPSGVYYSPLADNFFSQLTRCGMGTEFYNQWVQHQALFPSDPLRSYLKNGG